MSISIHENDPSAHGFWPRRRCLRFFVFLITNFALLFAGPAFAQTSVSGTYFLRCRVGTSAQALQTGCVVQARTVGNKVQLAPTRGDAVCRGTRPILVNPADLRSCLLSMNANEQVAEVMDQVRASCSSNWTDLIGTVARTSQPAWNTCSAIDLISKTDFDAVPLREEKRSDWAPFTEPSPKHVASSRPGILEPMGEIRGIVIHHSALPTDFGTAREILNGHIGKWADVGYHFLVCPDAQGVWRVHEGRDLKYKGAHSGFAVLRKRNTKGKFVVQKKVTTNSGQVGVLVCGNYEPANAYNPSGYNPKGPDELKQPPPEAVKQLGALLQKLKSDHPTIKNLYAHGAGAHARNPGHSKCPGQGCLAIVEAMRKKLALEGTEREWETESPDLDYPVTPKWEAPKCGG